MTVSLFIKRTFRPIGVLFGLALIFSIAGFVSPPLGAQENEAELKTLAEQLGSARFLEREDAMEALLERGTPRGVEILAEMFSEGNREAVSRGIFVLQQWAVAGDEPTQRAAQQKLEQMAQGEDPTVLVSRLAALSLDSLAQLRQERAVADLKEGGAKFGSRLVTFAVAFSRGDEENAVTIDDEWRGDDRRADGLRLLVNLEQVILRGSKIDSHWIDRLPKSPNLKSLILDRVELSDAALEDLSKLQGLQEMIIWYAPLTDETLKHLTKCPSLMAMRIYGSQMSREAIEKLRKDRPNITIDFRPGGGFFGIGCNDHPDGCVVTTVQLDTAAARAGLRPGDVITSFAGGKAKDFDTLTDLIGSQKPGDEVSLEILRDGQAMSLKATLGAWELPE